MKEDTDNNANRSRISRRKAMGLLLFTGIVFISTILFRFPLKSESKKTVSTITSITSTTKTPTLEEQLVDLLAPKGQLSVEQIKYFTEQAYILAYNDGVYDPKIRDVARESLRRVIDSLAENDFIYENVLALYQTYDEYIHDKKRSGDDLRSYENYVRNEVDKLAKNRKDLAIIELKFYYFQRLGAVRGVANN